MYYILNPDIGLRSWKLLPYAFYRRHTRNAEGLEEEEFEFLSKCDSKHDLPENDIAKKFLDKGFIAECEKDSTGLSPWQKLEMKNRYFPAMNWMITGRCNYNCLHCFNAKDNERLQSEFTMEQANQLLDQAQKAGINSFTITGGEPMVHKNFFEIIEGIYKRGMYVEELNTNGHFINKEALDKFKKIGCFPLIKISFDGIGHHDWLRDRKGAEKDTLDAIKLCLDEGFRVKVQMNVYRGNLDTLLETVETVEKLGAEEIRIIKTTEVPRWEENAPNQTLGFTEYYDEMLKFVKEFIKKDHKIIVDIWQMLQLLSYSKAYDIRAVSAPIGQFRGSKPTCPGNRGMIAVAANGNVYPCMQMTGTMDSRNFYLGNVFKEGLINLMTDSKYLDEVCKTIDDLEEHCEKCRNCEWFKFCCGGCVAVAWLYSNDTLSNDPFKCEFFLNGYYDKTVEIMGGWINMSPVREDQIQK